MTRKPLVTRFHLLVFAVLIAITATALVKVPADAGLPVHWGFDGKPDQVWPRNPALAVMPAIGLALTAVFALVGQVAPVEQIEPGRNMAEAMLTWLLGLLCAIQFSLILIGVGSDIDMVRLVAFAVAALLLVVGGLLTQASPNAYAALRLPWTMRSASAWTAVHRLTGALLALGGLGLGAVAWLRPQPADMLFGIGAAIVVPLVVGMLFSLIPR
ncbi:MAG: DUF1648 domain-containing protein [Devosia sp.]|nr:DUF1648 domain-containing protein [Devosia sp.]